MIERLGRVHTSLIEQAVYLLDGMYLLGCEAATVESDGVDTAVSDGFACGDDVRRDIFVDT